MSNKLVKIAEESAEGGFWLFLGNTSATFISALGAIVIARLLGPANYGLYSLSLTIPFLMAAIADFGVGPALTRYSAKLRVENKPLQLASMLKSGFLIKSTIGCLLLIITLTFSSDLASWLLNRPEVIAYLTFASALILFQAVFSAANSALIGMDEMGDVSFMMVTQSIIKTLISPLLILVGLSVSGALLGHVSSVAVAALLGTIFLFFKHYRGLRKNLEEADVELENSLPAMINYGFPVYLAVLLTTFLAQYQNLVLAHFASNKEIGNFNASINFSALISLIAFPISTVLFPAFSKTDPNRDNDSLKRMFTLTVKYASFLLVPSSVLVALLSKEFISVTYGGRYTSAPLYLSVYMGIFLLTGLGYLILGNLFSGVGETKETMNMALITVLTFLPSAPLMTKIFDVVGLIIALIASTLLGLIYGLLQAWRKYRLKIDALSESRIYLAAGIAVAPTLAIISTTDLPALIKMGVGSALYLLAYLTVAALIEAIKKQDVTNLSQILNGIKIVNFVAKPILIYESHVLDLRQRLLKPSLVVKEAQKGVTTA